MVWPDHVIIKIQFICQYDGSQPIFIITVTFWPYKSHKITSSHVLLLKWIYLFQYGILESDTCVGLQISIAENHNLNSVKRTSNQTHLCI